MRVNIARTKSDCVMRDRRAPSSPEAADDGGEDDQRDVAVDVEEGDVEAREISGADERVLVDQERHDRRPAEPVEEPEPGEPAEQRKRRPVSAWFTRAAARAVATPKRAGTEWSPCARSTSMSW